jgi:hypothetical protein
VSSYKSAKNVLHSFLSPSRKACANPASIVSELSLIQSAGEWAVKVIPAALNLFGVDFFGDFIGFIDVFLLAIFIPSQDQKLWGRSV